MRCPRCRTPGWRSRGLRCSGSAKCAPRAPPCLRWVVLGSGGGGGAWQLMLMMFINNFADLCFTPHSLGLWCNRVVPPTQVAPRVPNATLLLTAEHDDLVAAQGHATFCHRAPRCRRVLVQVCVGRVWGECDGVCVCVCGGGPFLLLCFSHGRGGLSEPYERSARARALVPFDECRHKL